MKKVMSLFLTVTVLLSMFAVGMLEVSANSDGVASIRTYNIDLTQDTSKCFFDYSDPANTATVTAEGNLAITVNYTKNNISNGTSNTTWLPNYVLLDSGTAIGPFGNDKILVKVVYKVTSADAAAGVSIGIGGWNGVLGSQVVTQSYKNHTSADVGKEFTLYAIYANIQATQSWLKNIKVAFRGIGAFEISSIKAQDVNRYDVSACSLVTYNNGAEVIDKEYVLNNTDITNTASDGDNIFVGWYTSSSVLTTRVTADTTLYAGWQKAVQEINLDLSNGIKTTGTTLNAGTMAEYDNGVLKVHVNNFERDLTNDWKPLWYPCYNAYSNGATFVLNIPSKVTVKVKYKVVNVDETYKDANNADQTNTAGLQIGIGASDGGNNTVCPMKYVKHYADAEGKTFFLEYSYTVENGTYKVPKVAFSGHGDFEICSVDLIMVEPGNYIETNVDLAQSTRICYDDPALEKADVTISYTEESDGMNVAFSEYSKNYEVIKADGSVNTGTVWAKGGIVALKQQDGSYVKFQSGKKYVINVAYDITKISTQDPYYAPQIGLCYNDSTGNDWNDNGQKIIAANRNTKCGSYVLSAVVNDNSLANKPLRLIFDGVGKCVIKSVSVATAEASSSPFYAVKYVDEFNALPNAQIIKKDAELPKYVQNAGFNFGGWFNGDEKVTTVTADGTLTAKWFTRTDINMDDSTNILDLVNIKKRLADNEDNVLLDVDRNGNVNASDIAVIRKQLFGKSIFTLNGNNIDDYSVYTSNSSLVLHKAAQELTYAVKGACGITLPIVNENTDKEIAIIVDEAIGLDNYSVELDGAKLVITAGSDYAASNAVQKVSEYIRTYGIITADIEFIGQYDNNYSMVGNYKYVWGDEFNGNALDTAKWTVVTEEKNGPYYLPTDQYYLASVASLNDSDPDNDFGGPWITVRVGGKTYMQEGTVRMIDQAGDNYFVQDGVLTMKTQRSSDGYTGTKISANKQFRYGIMEAKIKLCTSNGAASTFWARGVDDKDKETSVVNEFDFAENFGTDTVKPNLHTWLKHGAEHINHGEDIEKRDSITLNDDDYHYIAMEWTANVVRFFFDGELYLEQNIEDQETWNAFRLSTYLIFGISAPTDMYANYGGATPGQFLMDNIGSFCESQSIDYVRVYQLGNSDNTLSAR